MSESVEVLAFLNNRDQLAAITRLSQVQKYSQNFEVLNDLYLAALESQQWCYHTHRWDFVLKFMNVLKDFLHLQGYWRAAEEHGGYALEAAKQLQDRKAEVAGWIFYAGLIQDEQGNYEQAESYYQQSLDLAKAEGETIIQAEVWRRRGWLVHAQGDRHTAKTYYQQAMDLHCYAKDHLGQARDWRQLGLLAMEEGDFNQAERCLQTSLRLVEKRIDREAQRLQAGVGLDLGRIALQRGYLDNTRQHLEYALKHSEMAQDRLLRADTHFYLGILAEEQGDLPEATRQYQERLKLAREIMDRPGQASALIALGTLALQQLDYNQAQRNYEEALKLATPHNYAIITMQLGTLRYEQGNYQSATNYLQEALKTFQQLDHQPEVAGCYQQLGLVTQAKGQYQEAAEHYQTSLDLRLKLGLLHEAVQSLYQLGRLAQEQREYKVARRYYQQALILGEQVNFSDLPMIRQALENLRSGGRQSAL